MHRIFILSLAALCAAAPARRQNPPVPKKPFESTGFRLIAKVDPSNDMEPSVHNWVFTALRTGNGENMAVLSPPSSQSLGRVFYQNGTADQVADGETTILTDDASPPAPLGVAIQGPRQFDTTCPNEHSVFITSGRGSWASIAGGASWYPTLRNWQDEGPGTFLACNHAITYYGGARFITVQYAYGGEDISADCVPIVLLAQCASLDLLPDETGTGTISHAFAVRVRCYQDVSRVEIS